MLKKYYKILQNLNPGVIFEFGAFDGEDTFLYREEFPKAAIYSFEPDPVLYRSLESKMKQKGIHFFNYAISDVTGKADFWYMTGIKDKRERGPAGSLFSYTNTMKTSQGRWWRFHDAPIKVETISIQDFCKNEGISHIDFIHMDVEGAVEKVLNGIGDLRPLLVLAEVEGRDRLFCNAPSYEMNERLFVKLGYKSIGRSGADVLYKLITE